MRSFPYAKQNILQKDARFISIIKSDTDSKHHTAHIKNPFVGYFISLSIIAIVSPTWGRRMISEFTKDFGFFTKPICAAYTNTPIKIESCFKVTLSRIVKIVIVNKRASAPSPPKTYTSESGVTGNLTVPIAITGKS